MIRVFRNEDHITLLYGGHFVAEQHLSATFKNIYIFCMKGVLVLSDFLFYKDDKACAQ